jgi:predicted TIM-barrel fold metal-dependent hydrolase
VAQLDFQAFDADNHYYEATDAFTRHIDPAFAKRAMQWADIDGKRRLIVGGRVNRFIPNPTFDPVARPGSLDEYFRGKRAGDDLRAAFGDLDPISPAYRDRDARLALMDDQGLEGAMLFPTLGVGMEQALKDDPLACHAAFHAFNEWLEDDWGFNYRSRLFAAPMITLLDPDQAVAEIEWCLERDVRVVCMRSAPVMAPTGYRSPGDPVHDPFWARVAEAGITVAFHSGDSGYGAYAEDWGASGEMEAFRQNPFKTITTSDRPIFDTMAALICHGVFARFPGVRVATIESGSDWVTGLLRKMKKVYRQVPSAFPGGNPVDDFRAHVWVSPYYEDDIRALADSIGADHVLFGSDFPHAEGLAEPTGYVKELDDFTADETRMIMHDNARGLVEPRPAQ